MLLHIGCPDCGENGTILVADRDDIPPCPRCGRPFVVESSPDDEPSARSRAIDAAVVSWLSQGTDPPARVSDEDAGCPACGYHGLMAFVSDRANLICPACLQDYRTKSASVRTEFPCLVAADFG
jgi:hypothetical protein